MDINKLMLIGRLTRKPESRTSATGGRVATFTVATTYAWKSATTNERKDVTEFHRVVVWGTLADIAGTYLDSGSRVYVEGRLAYRTFTDRKGTQRRTSDVIADEIIMLGSRERKSPATGGAASP
jgi:single-strand DNA-binding protein